MSDECRKFMEEAEAEAKTGDHNLSAERWRNAGFCYSDADDLAKASECFIKSSEESILGRNKVGASDCFLYAIVVLLKSGKAEEASNVSKTADSKGLGAMESIKLAKDLVKALASKREKDRKEVYSRFSNIIEDNYWLRKTLRKVGIESP